MAARQKTHSMALHGLLKASRYTVIHINSRLKYSTDQVAGLQTLREPQHLL